MRSFQVHYQIFTHIQVYLVFFLLTCSVWVDLLTQGRELNNRKGAGSNPQLQTALTPHFRQVTFCRQCPHQENRGKSISCVRLLWRQKIPTLCTWHRFSQGLGIYHTEIHCIFPMHKSSPLLFFLVSIKAKQ